MSNSQDAPVEGLATGEAPPVAVEAEMSAASWRKYLTETNLLISADMASSGRSVGAGTFAHALLTPELPTPQPFKSQYPDGTDGNGGRLRVPPPTAPITSAYKACRCHKKKCGTCYNCIERHCTCKRGRTKRLKTSNESDNEEEDEPMKEEEPKDEKARKRTPRGKKLPPSSIKGCTCHRKKCEKCRNCIQRHCKCDGKNADTSEHGGDSDGGGGSNDVDEEKSIVKPSNRKRKQVSSCICPRKKCDTCQNCIARHCQCPPPESDSCGCEGVAKCPNCDHCVSKHCLCTLEKRNNLLMNQLLFVNALADGKIKLGHREKKDVVKDLKQRGFDPQDADKDFDYLFSLPISSLFKPDIDVLQEKADVSQEEFVAAAAHRAEDLESRDNAKEKVKDEGVDGNENGNGDENAEEKVDAKAGEQGEGGANNDNSENNEVNEVNESKPAEGDDGTTQAPDDELAS
ncbi:unnamed protein product [Aphanomyces euteiches]|uniref:Uncharacterized protein n=1 Tax=Aphanomyces euteiches TaxID=100861 RepID=A0A6G0X195_9STRA|nr:hypothetical protein Ae201684_009506 [Aphanomyces euteiches]KAH9085935.1 hypothetical protein Ae201684P_005631 [Aphanomyces euteiches]